MDACECTTGAKTYFATRPLYHSFRPEFITDFRNNKMVASEDGIGGAFEAVIFGGRSTNRGELASYFLPGCSNTLRVRENPVAGDNTDLEATNFGIFTNAGTAGTGGFDSIISFGARQSAVGLGLHYMQGFAFDCDKTKWWYVDLSMPITHVRNDFVVSETVQNDGGGVRDNATTSSCHPANMKAAFDQNCWCYGKISCDAQKKTGVADIELKLGRQWHYGETCSFASYLGVLIPTSNKPKGHYVFEPIIGHGGSAGLMWGGLVDYNMWNSCNDNWHLNWDLTWNSQYLFQTKQVRSFDLKNKPFSRYLALYADEAQAQEAANMCASLDAVTQLQGENLFTPGINILTRKVKVTPGFDFNVTTAFNLRSDCGFFSELGFNFYARRAECVKLDCWTDGPAIRGATGCGTTNSFVTIGNNSLVDCADQDFSATEYANRRLTRSDLDLSSAAHPAVLIYMVHGALGYEFNKECRIPMHLNFGAAYEFGDQVSVMKRWTLWGKYGIAF